MLLRRAPSVDENVVVRGAGDTGKQLTDEEILEFGEEYIKIAEDVDLMVHDCEGDGEYNNGEFAQYQDVIRDSKTPLYPGCKTGLTWLFSVLTFFK